MKKIILILGLIIISGCTSLLGGSRQQAEETKITQTQGVGVLNYEPVVDKMLVDTYNYVLLTVRNNAEGSSAENILVSLENVEPFLIYECNNPHGPGDIRQALCNQFFDDINQPYRSHKINKMLPDEELQFFWNIQAPNSNNIVEMAYTHTIYYTLEYDYKTTTTQTIAGISQQEYLEQSKEGPVTLSGQTISSPGELKLDSKTQQPLIYNEGGGTVDFTLEFEINNRGEGIPKPGSNIIIAVKKDLNTKINEALAKDSGWRQYNISEDISKTFDKIFPSIEFEELGLEGGNIRKDLWLTSLESRQLTSGKYVVVLPVTFNTEGIYEPQKILTFSAYVSYTYLKEGSTTISVYPT